MAGGEVPSGSLAPELIGSWLLVATGFVAVVAGLVRTASGAIERLWTNWRSPRGWGQLSATVLVGATLALGGPAATASQLPMPVDHLEAAGQRALLLNAPQEDNAAIERVLDLLPLRHLPTADFILVAPHEDGSEAEPHHPPPLPDPPLNGL